MYKLNKHIDAQGMPETEKKDYVCKQCGEQWASLDALDNIDMATGEFLCKRCGFVLQEVVDDGANENEGMKRLNVQFAQIETLLRQIDETNVPENDFTSALAAQKPVTRSDAHPGARTEVVDLPNRNLQSTKGLELKPEKIAVQLQDDEDVKRENAKADAAARKAKEAAQNQLPVWIAQSTISGDITVSGAKEERERKAREAHAGVFKDEPSEDVKPDADEEDVMAQYWADMARERERQAAEDREEDEDEEDEDEFEDVDVSATPAASNGVANGKAASSNGFNTPNAESSNATDDERPAKRARSNEPTSSALASSALANDQAEAASDEDEDDIQFEDV
jgi:transcription initiation factor TFIIE subunit alpha